MSLPHISAAEPEAQPTAEAWLDWLQTGLLCLIAFIGVISSPRLLLLEVITEQRNIPLDFVAINLSLADYGLIALIVLTVGRLLLGARYRQRFTDSLTGIFTRRGGLFWVALLAWMGIGMVWAREPLMLRFTTLHAVAALFMALIAAELVAHQQIWPLLAALIGGAVLQAGLAVLQVIQQGPLGLSALGEISRLYYETAAFYRPPGLSMHPNYLGGYLMVALFGCVLLGWLLWRGRATRGIIILIAPLALLIGIGVVATVSRSAILSTVVGFAPLVLVWFARLRGRVRWIVVGGLAILVAAGALWAIVVVGGDVDTRFFSAREFFFEYSWRVIQQAPILGVGAGNLMAEVGRIYGDSTRELLPVHNVYLYLWAEVGIPGFVLFMLAYLSLLRSLLWSMRRDPASWIWGGALLGIASIMFFDNYWWAVHPFRVLLFWVIGLAWGLSLRQPAPDQQGL